MISSDLQYAEALSADPDTASQPYLASVVRELLDDRKALLEACIAMRSTMYGDSRLAIMADSVIAKAKGEAATQPKG